MQVLLYLPSNDIFCGGGGGYPETPNSEQQTNFFSSSLFSIRFEKCDYAEF